METATIYTITIEPVEMGGWFALTIGISVVLCGIGMLLAHFSSGTFTVPGVFVVIAGICGGVFGPAFLAIDTVPDTVNQRIETQLRQDIGLKQIAKTGSDSIRSGFIALKDGQAVVGTIEEVGRDRYEVVLRNYQ